MISLSREIHRSGQGIRRRGSATQPLPEVFSEWLLSQASADSIHILLFFGTAGRTLNRLIASNPRHSFPRAAQLQLSPVEVMLAGVQPSSIEEDLKVLIRDAEGRSVREFFDYLGVPLPGPQFMRDIQLPEETIVHASTRNVFTQFLYAYRWEIFKTCRQKRRELFSQFLQARMTAGMRVGIVDLGWNLSIQTTLGRALEAMFEVQTYAYCFSLRDNAESLTVRSVLRTHAMISADNFSVSAVETLYNMRPEIETLFGYWPEDAADSVPDIQDLLQQHR